MLKTTYIAPLPATKVLLTFSAHLSPETGELQHTFSAEEGKFQFGAFSTCLPVFVTLSSTGELASWDATGFGLKKKRLTDLTEVSVCAVSPSTPSLAVRSSDGTVLVWDYSKDVIADRISTTPDRVTRICFSSDGRFLLIGGQDACVRMVPLSPSSPALRAVGGSERHKGTDGGGRAT